MTTFGSEEHDWERTGARALHWFCEGTTIPTTGACWVTLTGNDVRADWTGWSATAAEDVRLTAAEAWGAAGFPWMAERDASEAPFVRWFIDGRTSAAFNEIDRHVLADPSGDTNAFHIEPDPQQSRGGSAMLPLGALLEHSTLAAVALRDVLEIATLARIGICLPNGPWAVVWIEACKRGAWPFCAVAAGTAASALGERLADTAVSAFVASDDGSTRAALEACSPLSPLVVLMRGDTLPEVPRTPTGTARCHNSAGLLSHVPWDSL